MTNRRKVDDTWQDEKRNTYDMENETNLIARRYLKVRAPINFENEIRFNGKQMIDEQNTRNKMDRQKRKQKVGERKRKKKEERRKKKSDTRPRRRITMLANEVRQSTGQGLSKIYWTSKLR